MSMSQPSGFYVTGGTLRRDAPSYVARRADEELYGGLSEERFCYVLTSRQMGKSSLMVRTAARLRESGAAVAVLDLTAIGQNLTPEQWYDGLLGRVGQQLDLEDELEDFWDDNRRLGPLQRWTRALFTETPANDEAWEQTLGRMHRAGQTADEVHAWCYRHTEDVRDAFTSARRNSRWVGESTGSTRRLWAATTEFELDLE
jgi:hypothetical protein